ncbi:MAG: 50S ribosomal protein L3 [Bacteroidetes bacterium]|nr:50S ribosomal protein L3 [Bacteroidota bacterium]MCL5034036.1 50S ribosomal protein L3 [Bacteroidota bacterium]
MNGLLGKKLGMTSVFDEKGNSISVTVIEAGPCPVTAVKTKERDGYEAIQLAFGEKPERNETKAMKGHFAKAGVKPARVLCEFDGFNVGDYKIGDVIIVDKVFSVGDKVSVTGTSKGKGFQGVVKRHHFGGGAITHGQSDRTRAPGSVGSSSYPSRTFKGLRMAGRMGGKRSTMKSLKVVRLIPASNLILVEGSVPGPTNGYLEICREK